MVARPFGLTEPCSTAVVWVRPVTAPVVTDGDDAATATAVIHPAATRTAVSTCSLRFTPRLLGRLQHFYTDRSAEVARG